MTRNGRYAYTSNTGSGSVSGYAVSRGGKLSLLNANGITATTGAGSGPIDMALTKNSKFLYTLNGGNGSIGIFRVGNRGSLTEVGNVPGLPAGANGLAAR